MNTYIIHIIVYLCQVKSSFF